MIETLTAIQLVLAWSAVTIGALLQGSIGIGLGMIGAPLLVLIRPDLVPGPLLLNALLLTLLVTRRERRSVALSDLQWALIGRVLGVVFAATALTVMSRAQMSYAVGGVVLLVVAVNAAGWRVRPTRAALFGAGTVSGVTGTVSSIGGPPVALLYQHAEGARLRGPLNAYMAVGSVMSLSALAVIGRFGWHEMVLGISMWPGVIAGFVVSRRTARMVDGGYLRIGVLTTSALAGFLVILRQLLGL